MNSAASKQLSNAIMQVKENNKYGLIGSGTSNKMMQHSNNMMGMGMGSGSGSAMGDDEQVNIGSLNGTHTNTTPITNKHQYRYGGH